MDIWKLNTGVLSKYVQEIQSSELFFVSHYLKQAPEAKNHFAGAIGHYLEVGYRKGLNPNPLFESDYFLASNHLSEESKLLPPFFVYVKSTGIEAFSPHPLFDAGYYIKSNPDLEECADRIQPLWHFIYHGAFEGRNPNKDFDSKRYLALKPELRIAKINPLIDFVATVDKNNWHILPQIKDLEASELFCVPFYLKQAPDAEKFPLGPIGHYLVHGFKLGLSPHPLFDPTYFLNNNNLSAELLKLPPFLAYVRSNGFDGLEPHQLFKARYYIQNNPDLFEHASLIQPLKHFNNDGGFEGRNPNEWFDSKFYLARKSHLREARINPLADYVLSPQNYQWAFHPFYDVEYDTKNGWKPKPGNEPHLGADFANNVHADFTQWDKPYDKLLALSKEPFTHLFIIPGLIRAGAERAACAYIRHFQEIEGMDNVLVISADYDNHPSSNWLSEGTRLIDAKAILSLVKGHEEMAFLLTAFILKKKPAFTYSINSFSAITAMARYGEILKSSTRIFLTLFGYETYTANDFRLMKHPIFRGAFEMSDYLVTDTKRLRDEIERQIPIRKSPEKITAHCYLASKHLIELVRSHESRKGEALKPPCKILWASRLVNSKRPDMLVEIAKHFPEIEFLAYGSTDGDITGESAIQIERIRNTPNISFRGPYSDFSEIDLSEVIGFLYTSESDGIPWVLLEATAAGLPIIAPDVGGIGEFLTQENSWLLDRFDDLDAYIKSINQLLSDQELANLKASRALQTLQRQHSEEAFAACLRSILQR